MMESLSLCLTTFNRTQMLYEAIEQVKDDPRLSEIVIVDDHSDEEYFTAIKWQFQDNPKIKLFRNERNLDCYFNKKEAIEKSTSEWVIIFDSDNLMTKEYLDRIENLMIAGVNPKTLYQPEFAKPHFDFRAFAGQNITKSNVSEQMPKPSFETMLNAMNYLVNRAEYLRIWDGETNPVTSDSIYQNYNWLKAGNSIYVTPGLEYEHKVHSGSHYQQNVRRTPQDFHKTIINLLKTMK